MNPNAPDICFTMTEVIPGLKKILMDHYNHYIIIQSRYILTENRLKSLLSEQTYHLSIEYYAQPSFVYLLIPHHIEWNHKFCNFSCDDRNEIALTPMNIDEVNEMEEKEKKLQTFKNQGDISLIAREERDFTFEELTDYSNWTSQKIALKERDINLKFLTPIVTAYMNLNTEEKIEESYQKVNQ